MKTDDHGVRVDRYSAVSTALALLSDRDLGRLVDAAPALGVGIGGTSVQMEIAGGPVFVKRIPLTDLERRPDHVMSTANVFELPAYCQYGVGGPGFGAWRELAANAMTTNWVLARECESFPLMYGWRVLPGTIPTPDEHADIDRTVDYWHGSPAVRHRLASLATATASVVLFLEFVPRNLLQWLGDSDDLASACAMVEAGLRTDIRLMNARGLHHFDAHFRNILTDGRRLYFADLGLATSTRFALDAAESEFLARNESHDACYTVTQLVNWLVYTLVEPADAFARNEFIRRHDFSTLPAWAAGIVERYAPVVVVMNDFHWQLFGASRMTPYPVDDIRRACASVGLIP